MTSPTSLEQKNDCSDRRQFVVRWSAVCIEHPLMVVNGTRDPVRVFSTCLNRETTHSLGFLCRVTSSSTELISSAVRDGRSSRALRAPRVKLRSQGTYLHIGHLATDRVELLPWLRLVRRLSLQATDLHRHVCLASSLPQ
jgi:hypothetical protein